MPSKRQERGSIYSKEFLPPLILLIFFSLNLLLFLKYFFKFDVIKFSQLAYKTALMIFFTLSHKDDVNEYNFVSCFFLFVVALKRSVCLKKRQLVGSNNTRETCIGKAQR